MLEFREWGGMNRQSTGDFYGSETNLYTIQWWDTYNYTIVKTINVQHPEGTLIYTMDFGW